MLLELKRQLVIVVLGESLIVGSYNNTRILFQEYGCWFVHWPRKVS
ncbi:MAG: hypothetical protein L0M06_12470 [Enterococcus sp.]|nr:hypothetical protein [Enterococcus sp.]